ncbi:hypothetical protein GX51_06477 [Blastomyces parvus]|uniref:Uncharacterized protein n=1 Tax=Blastomyces parvus TaxID=2060905 RepID=A0A2B7WRE1_9EURO|nr:hypothetical protein GX51_06477 [Blastomyces parvus]
MTGLHIPGIPTRPNDKAARKRNGPAFKTFPHRVTYKEVSISHSFSDSVRSSVGSSAAASSSSSCSYSSRSSASSSVEFVPHPVAAVPRSSASTSTRYTPRVVSHSLPQAGEVARPRAPIPSSRFSTLSKPQPLCSSRPSRSISTTSSRSGPFVLPRTRPRAGDAPIPPSRYSTRSPPPARPCGPIPWSRDSTLSRPQSTRSSLPVRSLPSSTYSTLSKLRDRKVSPRCSRPTSATSTRSSPAPPTRSIPSSTSIRSDSFPSTRCFIAAALKAATTRSSPASTASPRSSSTTSTRFGSFLSSAPPPPVRFNCAGDRLEAVREVVRRHRREHAQLCSDSSNASKAVSSSHRSTSGRRNVKSTKSVKFGGDTVYEVDRWIKPGVHTQRDPPKIIGKLVGWSVTPLEEPEDDEDINVYEWWLSLVHILVRYTAPRLAEFVVAQDSLQQRYRRFPFVRRPPRKISEWWHQSCRVQTRSVSIHAGLHAFRAYGGNVSAAARSEFPNTACGLVRNLSIKLIITKGRIPKRALGSATGYGISWDYTLWSVVVAQESPSNEMVTTNGNTLRSVVVAKASPSKDTEPPELRFGASWATVDRGYTPRSVVVAHESPSNGQYSITPHVTNAVKLTTILEEIGARAGLRRIGVIRFGA